ncbi:sensor histidine kinase [Streptomyces sp. NPDC058657]|uniref:sensor histidine kinase n=1 Tax=unclassified Streptomyces TaxID=2593676 RepID=UPI00365C3145
MSPARLEWLLGRRARAGWLHLIVGAALLMPFYLVAVVVVGPVVGAPNVFVSVPAQFLALLATLPMTAVFGLFAPARPLSVAAVRSLKLLPDAAGGGDGLAGGAAGTRAARVRTAGWFTLHLTLGGVIGGASLALTPFAVLLVVLPFVPALRGTGFDVPPLTGDTWTLVLSPVIGVVSMVLLAAASAGSAALLARAAPVLLGPTPADRLAAAERRAADLAVRNRLARELHDSVGHALSAVTLQAGAARKVLDSGRASDVEFVREALAAIEETTRRTVGELDAVLGVLRRGEDSPADGGADFSGPALDALDDLVARSGVPVARTGECDPAEVPDPVSREAYRIVQEGLSNALRHGGQVPVSLHVALTEGELEIVLENPLPAGGPVVRPGGGRGLRGTAERAILLGGHSTAGPQDGMWRLYARLPLAPDTGAARTSAASRTSEASRTSDASSTSCTSDTSQSSDTSDATRTARARRTRRSPRTSRKEGGTR